MKQLSNFLLLLGIILFLIIKLPHLSIRLSDTNTYFYTGYKLLQQNLLYKEIFFTNLPLFPYISSVYQMLTFGDIKMFYTTAFIEVIIIAFLIYIIVHTKTKNYIISAISSLIYIFSSIVLVTSDHQTGVFTAAIFSLAAYVFLEKKYFLLSGFFAALAIMTKAYFLPIVLSFIIYLLLVKVGYKNFFLFLGGFMFSAIVIVSPFLIFAYQEFISDLFFSLTRSGVDKQQTLWTFLQYDFVLFSVFIFNLFNFKKNSLFALISLMSIVFFIFYQNLYYLYLNFLIPFLAVSFYNLWNFLTQRGSIIKIILPTIVFLTIGLNIAIYIFYSSNLYKVQGIDVAVELIKKENPEHLYGATGITSAFAYLTKKPLLNNIIDTNPSIFKKGFFNRKELTQKAVEGKTIVIDYGKSEDNIFDRSLLNQHCAHLENLSIRTPEENGKISLLKCY